MQEEFGRYTLMRRLAVGGMAEIFLAALHGDAGFEKKVVVKRILPHLGDDADFVRMFIDEAVLAARLAHPNIVQVYDFGSVANSYFIAMEYIEGCDLHRVLRMTHERGHRLSPAEVASIGEGVARGLAYTHALTDDDGNPLGIVHRDVSPHNLMISVTGDPKVMDFGIAKAAARFSRTATGTIKGKLAYMAPEQASGHGATKFSDQFALGVVLWECLAGRRLFTSDTEVSLMQAVIACDVPSLRSLRPDVPEELERIINRALQPKPADRYPDIGELAAELMTFRFSLGEGGIVQLDQLAREFATDDSDVENPDWSWAEAQVAVGGTRPMAPGGRGAVKHMPPPAATPIAAALKLQQASPAAQHASNPPQQTPPHGWHAHHHTPPHGIGPRTPTPARRRTTGPVARFAARRRNIALPPGTVVPPRYRTTWRIDRSPRPGRWRPVAALGAALIIALGVGLMLLWWTNMTGGHSGSTAIAALLHRDHNGSMVVPLRDSDAWHGVGHLSLRTEGPAVDVYLGTARLGTTPLTDEEVPAGRLHLRLINEAVGIARNYEIFVPEGGSAEGIISSR